MIAIEGVFSKKNLEQAFFFFFSKNHSEKKANVSPYREMWELKIYSNQSLLIELSSH